MKNEKFPLCSHFRLAQHRQSHIRIMVNADSQLSAPFKTPLFKEKKEIISFSGSFRKNILGLNYFFFFVCRAAPSEAGGNPE